MNTYLITPEIGKPFKVQALTEELARIEAEDWTWSNILYIHLWMEAV